jgi:hypothetical protein
MRCTGAVALHFTASGQPKIHPIYFSIQPSSNQSPIPEPARTKLELLRSVSDSKARGNILPACCSLAIGTQGTLLLQCIVTMPETGMLHTCTLLPSYRPSSSSLIQCPFQVGRGMVYNCWIRPPPPRHLQPEGRAAHLDIHIACMHACSLTAHRNDRLLSSCSLLVEKAELRHGASNIAINKTGRCHFPVPAGAANFGSQDSREPDASPQDDMDVERLVR